MLKCAYAEVVRRAKRRGGRLVSWGLLVQAGIFNKWHGKQPPLFVGDGLVVRITAAQHDYYRVQVAPELTPTGRLKCSAGVKNLLKQDAIAARTVEQWRKAYPELAGQWHDEVETITQRVTFEQPGHIGSNDKFFEGYYK